MKIAVLLHEFARRLGVAISRICSGVCVHLLSTASCAVWLLTPSASPEFHLACIHNTSF